MSILTKIGSGGVERPDVTLKEDLTAIEQTANTAKTTADDTAGMLETRVPEGRTINNIPMDHDIELTADLVGTYSRQEIDDKIAAVEGGAYNPVKVNGHLLDRDVILTPADLSTYTGQEIEGKLDQKVDKTTTVNGHALDQNVLLTAADVDAYSKTETDTALNQKVDKTTTVNGHALDQNVSLTAADVDAYSKTETDTALNQKVDKTTEINGYPLNANFNLGAGDVGALPKEDAVPRTYTINGEPMIGTGLTIPAGVSLETLEDALKAYLRDGTTIDTGTFAESATASGFYRYGPDVENGTNMTDRPPGSESGVLIAIKREDNTDPANVIVTYEMLAMPDETSTLLIRKAGGSWQEVSPEPMEKLRIFDNDLDWSEELPNRTGLLYDARTGDIWEYANGWTKLPTSAYTSLRMGRSYYNPRTGKIFYYRTVNTIEAVTRGLQDMVAVENSRIRRTLNLANNTPIRYEETPDGTVREVLTVTPAKKLQVGSSHLSLDFFAAEDPVVTIDGVDYKLYSEHNPPPVKADGAIGSYVFAKYSGSGALSFGQTVAGSTLTASGSIGTGGNYDGGATLSGTWVSQGALPLSGGATLFRKIS